MNIEDKQARSVFVGNIPHGTTEEQMKEYFSDVGTVLSFRIVYDRETGNPKGYGFAEYLDMEMAQTAIRNLNGREFNGRILRVDKASSQADELRMIHQITGGPPIENPYGENVPPEKAPEAISRAVASLPPEQMFELMKQMKACIQNNPNEARTMLLNNPQLAYALLQAQVVMKIVDPQVAQALLHRKPEQIAPIMPMGSVPQAAIQQSVASMQAMPLMQPSQAQIPLRPPPQAQVPIQTQIVQQQPYASQPLQPQPLFKPEQLIDPRFQSGSRPMAPVVSMTQPQVPVSQMAPQPVLRPTMAPVPQQRPLNVATSQVMQPQQPQPQISPASAQQSQISTADQEKAALIMQVLQLTDEQIAMLPPEQRQSILVLREQIAQRTGGIVPQM